MWATQREGDKGEGDSVERRRGTVYLQHIQQFRDYVGNQKNKALINILLPSLMGSGGRAVERRTVNQGDGGWFNPTYQ